MIAAIAEFQKHEAHCEEQRLTPAGRLAYHQEHSVAVMKELKDWMAQQIEDKRVEPNSRLGAAFDYLLELWKALTRFLTVPGAPLDNNQGYAARGISDIL